jgi:hypothetical protein
MSEKNAVETIEAPAPNVPNANPQIPTTVASASATQLGLIPVIVTVAVLLVLAIIIIVASTLVPASDGIARYFLNRTAGRSPMLIFAVAGIVFALTRWKLSSRAATMTMVALAVYLIDMVVYTTILYWLPTAVDSLKVSATATRFFYSVVYFIEDIVYATMIVLLVAAAFTDRKRAKPESEGYTP